MAQPAADAQFQQLGALLRPVPGRWQQTLRLTLTATLTCLFAEIWGLPEPALAVYVAFFMWKPDRVLSMVLALALMVIAALLIAVVILLARMVLDDPMLRVATIVAIAFGVSWLGSASRLQPIAPIIALVVAFALDILGSIPIPLFATKALLWAWLFAGIPALATLLVSLLVAPSPRRLLTRALALRLRAAAAALRGEPGGRDAVRAHRSEGQAALGLWLRLARIERRSDPKDLDALDSARRATTAILLAVDAGTTPPNAQLPHEAALSVAEHLDAMASILDRNGYPIDTRISLAIPAMSPGAAIVWVELEQAIGDFSGQPPSAPSAGSHGRFFEVGALENPAHVHYALKTTAAAMTCYLLYHALDWPGIHTAFLTCFIVALPTAAESLEKLGLRLTGAILGGGVGLLTLLFILPRVDDISGLLLVVALGTLPAAWIAVGSPRLSYAGFQWAFAFYLTVVQGTGPAFDITIARDRLIGILIGNLVTAFVFTRLWPVSIARAWMRHCARRWWRSPGSLRGL